MYINDVVSAIGKNIRPAEEYKDDMLFRYVLKAYQKLTGRNTDNEPPYSLCLDIRKWYMETYMTNKNAVGDGTGVIKPSRNAGNLRELTRNVQEIMKADTDDQKTEYLKIFNKTYSFSSVDRITFLKLLHNPQTPPRQIDILRIAVGFKLTEQECNELLYHYGYMKLHSKNPFHIVVYIVLKELEKESPIERLTKFDQFKRVHDLLYETLCLMNQPSGVQDGTVDIGMKQPVDHNSTTLLYNSVLPQLDSENCASYIAKHRDIFNERHRKVLEEYRRLESIFHPLFFDGSAKDNSQIDKALWKNSDSSEDYPSYSLYKFIYDFCHTVTANHFHRDMHTTIFKDTRVHTPTREIMIILWIFEYCWANACIPCEERLAIRYLRRYAGLLTDRSVSDLTLPVLRRLACSGSETQKAAVTQMGQKELLNTIGVYPSEENDSNVYLDIGKILGTNNSTPQYYGSQTAANPPEENENATYWRGSDLKAILDQKLSRFGMLPISARNQFDHTITELCKITYKFENGTGAYYYDGEKIYGIIPGDKRFYRTTDQSQPVDSLPEKLKFLFYMLNRISKNCMEPLECNISGI